MSSPDYLRSRRSPGRVPYPLMAWLPQRYALLSAGRPNRTGNRGPRPGGRLRHWTDSKHRPPKKRRFEGWVIPSASGVWSRLRVGRELNPPGGKPDPRVKSPMLCLAELPTRLSPQQTAVLLRSSRRPLDPSEPFRDAAKKPRTVINAIRRGEPRWSPALIIDEQGHRQPLQILEWPPHARERQGPRLDRPPDGHLREHAQHRSPAVRAEPGVGTDFARVHAGPGKQGRRILGGDNPALRRPVGGHSREETDNHRREASLKFLDGLFLGCGRHARLAPPHTGFSSPRLLASEQPGLSGDPG